jgi:formiminotetrahydrofolate cyclodeaminase|tara:strand:+ start:6028 stop:6645 length:618 start_codon:yes stop_codon:yes gene_type:complete
MNEGYISVLNKIASDSPTPGGGTVAALTLSHANSLAMMVARLTLGKSKWENGQEIASEVIKFSEHSLKKSLSLANDDAKAFDKVMDAYRLPKSNEMEIKQRKEMILAATIGAASTPSLIALEGEKLLSKLPHLAEFGNANAITDLAASAELAYTAVYIASLNVKINVDSLDNEELSKIQEITLLVLAESKVLLDEIRNIVSRRME